MSLSWPNRVPHQNRVSVTALTARTRGCDCGWREGLEGGIEGRRPRGRPSPSVAGDRRQNRRGRRRAGVGLWRFGPGPGSRPRHSPRTGQRGRAVWALCGRCPGPGRGTRFLPPLCVPPDASPFSSGRRSEQVFTRAPLLRLSPNSVASWVRGGYDSNIQISGERMSAHGTAPVNYGSPRPSRTRERDGLGAETADRAGATPRGKLPRAPPTSRLAGHARPSIPGPVRDAGRRGPWLGLPVLCRMELLALGSPPPWSGEKASSFLPQV